MNGPWVRHLAFWLVGAAVFRFAVVPAEACPTFTADEIHAGAVTAGVWLESNLDENGRFVYGYDRATNAENPGYSIVRHAGATNSLYQLVTAGETQFLPAADRSLEYLLDLSIDHDDWTAIAEPGDRARLGAVGFVIAALVERRTATGASDYDDLMRAMGRFIVNQQEPDGSILAYWNQQTLVPSPNQYGQFATGEAVWALIELDNIFPDEGWWEAAEPTLHYMADGSREEKEGHLARLPDHWAAYALEAAGTERLDDELVEYAKRLAGYFSIRLRIEDQRTGTPFNVLVRGFPGPPSGVGTAGEGMAALYRLAKTDPRLSSLTTDMKERMVCTAGVMVERQIGVDEASAEPNPELAFGAWFYRSYTQVDDQQHVLSALLGASQSMREKNE